MRLCIPKAKTSPQTCAPAALPRLAASPSSTGQSLGGREIEGGIDDLPGLKVTSYQVKGGQGQHGGGSQAHPTAVSARAGGAPSAAGASPPRPAAEPGGGERASQGLAGGAPPLLPPAQGRQQGHLLVQTEQGCRRAPLPREGPLQGRERREPEKHREFTSTTSSARRLASCATTGTTSEEGFIISVLSNVPQKLVKDTSCNTVFNYLMVHRKMVKTKATCRV